MYNENYFHHMRKNIHLHAKWQQYKLKGHDEGKIVELKFAVYFTEIISGYE